MTIFLAGLDGHLVRPFDNLAIVSSRQKVGHRQKVPGGSELSFGSGANEVAKALSVVAGEAGFSTEKPSFRTGRAGRWSLNAGQALLPGSGISLRATKD